MKEFLEIETTNNIITKNINMGKNEKMNAYQGSDPQLLDHELIENNVEDTNHIQYVKDVVIIHIGCPEVGRLGRGII